MMLKTMKVSDIGRVVTGNTPSRMQPELYGNHKLFIKPTDISEGEKYTYSPDECYSEAGYIKYKNSLIPQGATCVVTIGSIGKKITKAHVDCFINQAMNAVIPYDNFDEEYVYYLLLHNLSKLKMLDSGTASGRENVSKSAFSNLQVNVIENKEIQTKIGLFLASIDNLIENNQKQIKLLEEAAKRLYKEWFVHLRFPGHEHTKILGGVPEGWVRSAFESLGTLIKDNIRSKDIVKGTPYIGLEHIPRKSLCLNVWGDALIVNSNKYRYIENDVLFGKIRPYFHKVGFAMNEGVCSTDAMVFRANESMFGLLLMTAFSEAFVSHTSQTCKEGAKMPRADWDEMRRYPVLMPSDTVLKDFDERIIAIIKAIKALSQQIILLQQARDMLLPKLMSGEIEV